MGTGKKIISLFTQEKTGRDECGKFFRRYLVPGRGGHKASKTGPKMGGHKGRRKRVPGGGAQTGGGGGGPRRWLSEFEKNPPFKGQWGPVKTGPWGRWVATLKLQPGARGLEGLPTKNSMTRGSKNPKNGRRVSAGGRLFGTTKKRGLGKGGDTTRGRGGREEVKLAGFRFLGFARNLISLGNNSGGGEKGGAVEPAGGGPRGGRTLLFPLCGEGGGPVFDFKEGIGGGCFPG